MTKLKQLISAKNLDQSVSDWDQQTVIENLTHENNRLKGVDKERELLEEEVQNQGSVISALKEKLEGAKDEIA